MVEVADLIVIFIIYPEAVAYGSCCKCAGNTASILQHVIERVSIGVDTGITEIATILERADFSLVGNAQDKGGTVGRSLVLDVLPFGQDYPCHLARFRRGGADQDEGPDPGLSHCFALNFLPCHLLVVSD